jgi:hypothetical protein
MVMPKPSPLLKPTLDTKYHIDYKWWDRAEEDLRTYLISHLLPELLPKTQNLSIPIFLW